MFVFLSNPSSMLEAVSNSSAQAREWTGGCRALRVRKEPRGPVWSMASCQSYQEYDRFRFGPDEDDWYPARGPLEVRNADPADSVTDGASLHEEPMTPQTSRFSMIAGGEEEDETVDDFDSHSSCDLALAQMSYYPAWNGAGSHSTVVEQAGTSDREHCYQSISQPFLPEQMTRTDTPSANKLFAHEPGRPENLPPAFLFGDSRKEMVDTEDNSELNSRVLMNISQHKDGILTPQTPNKTKSIKVVPTNPLNTEEPSRSSGSPTPGFVAAYRRQNNDFDHWDTLASQAEEPIDTPACPPQHMMHTISAPMSSIVTSPPSPPMSRFIPQPLSIRNNGSTPPNSNNDTLFYPSMIPEHGRPDPVQHRRIPRRMRTIHSSSSDINFAPYPAGTNTNPDFAIVFRLRFLQDMAFVQRFAQHMEENRGVPKRLEDFKKVKKNTS